jgi:hypothetical protein
MDDILTALLAVCAIMLVFSTAVTVVQEGVHKAMQSRREGMLRLQKAVYTRAIAPRLLQAKLLEWTDNDRERAKRAERFALDMTANHALVQTGIWKWASEAPVLRRYFGGRFEQMSTHQFAEQLAHTEVGKVVAPMGDDALKETLRTYAYEFERFGDGSSAIFRKRAKATAVVIGLLLAVLVNVDILNTFKSLTHDRKLADRLVQTVSSDSLNKLAADLQSTAAAAPAAQGVKASEENTAEGAARASLADVNYQLGALNTQLLALQTAQADYMQLGVPIGPHVFPFCQGIDSAALAPAPANGAVSAQDAVKRAQVDPRCRDNRGAAGFMVNLFAKDGQRYLIQPALAEPKVLWQRIVDKDGDGFLWLMSVGVAGAGFGLGAPFWLNLFRRLASAAPNARVSQLADVQLQDDTPKAVVVRDGGATTPDALLTAFRTVSTSVAQSA